MTEDPRDRLEIWATELDSLADRAWTALSRGVADRRAPARHPTLATISPDGWPETRMVVLRAADRAAGRVEIHSDLLAAKVAALRANRRAALHVWDASARLQIRLSAEVRILDGDAVAAIWQDLPDVTRHSYGTTPPPGQPIAEALDYRKPADPARLAVLDCRLIAMDLLHLGSQHRRARYDAASGWTGQWLAP